jgi:hypothetical protein
VPAPPMLVLFGAATVAIAARRRFGAKKAGAKQG